MFQPIYHVSVSPTDGNGSTQGQRKTLTRVGFEPTTFEFDLRCSTDIILSIFGFSKSIENLQTLEHADNVTNSLAEIALRRWLRCN